MRLYVYIDKDMVKKLAANITNISFDIDFFEYSEKRGYTIRNDTSIRPDVDKKMEEKDKCKLRVGASHEQGTLSSIEIIRRYINIEDVSNIKNNSFYYAIIESIKEDERIKIKKGLIENIENDYIVVGEDKFILDSTVQNGLNKLFEYKCSLTLLGYKINDLRNKYDVLKTIAIYIE